MLIPERIDLQQQVTALVESRRLLTDARQALAIDYKIPERSRKFDGGMTCIISSQYHEIEDLIGVIRRANDGIVMNPRGLGLNWGPCFICGAADVAAKPDFASYVRNNSDGEKIVELFKSMRCVARLDYREWEQNHVQVKVVSCDTHEQLLKNLMVAIAKFNFVSPNILAGVLKGEVIED